jgi:hypothetical protein
MPVTWEDLPDDHPILQGFWVGTVVKPEEATEITPPEEPEEWAKTK